MPWENAPFNNYYVNSPIHLSNDEYFLANGSTIAVIRLSKKDAFRVQQ